MRCILREETDPYFNIAAEEYILKNSTEDVFMIWRNDPSVIIGKHQNAFAEINHEFIKKKKIAVIRRISGGGAVYHDKGNLNFSFISHGETEKLIDFHKFTLPVMQALQKLNLQVAVGNRNSLYINGYKISGNAEHVFRNKVLHHGTLLYSTELNALDRAIHPPVLTFVDKAVKSVRSKVANISEFLDNNMTIQEFMEYLLSAMTKAFPGSYIQPLTKREIQEIAIIRNEKYATWAWNYGYSPKFSFSTSFLYNKILFPVIIDVSDGHIQNISIIEAEDSEAEELFDLVTCLKGLPLKEDVIKESLKARFSSFDIKHIVSALFIGGTAEHLQNMNV
ncbi:MAG TPA: lipoate--protein ligase [Lentimicrobium sp.]|nr:lipoate--protein ligase [Lentimicrobium sp.]